jgi:hypothetical protein
MRSSILHLACADLLEYSGTVDDRSGSTRRDERISLEYAPAAPRRGWPLRKWLLLIGVLLLVYLSAEYGTALVRQARIQIVQSRCAGFDYAQGTVVYESGKSMAEVGEGQLALTDLSIWPAKGVVLREPACWSSLKNILFGPRQFWPPGPPPPKALVHRMRNAKGDERLIAIIVAPTGKPGAPPWERPKLGLVAAIVAPAGWGGEPTWIGNSQFLVPGFEAGRRVKIYAGSMNPNEPAKFTIRYEMDGQSGTIEGLFASDGEVRMKVRDGPATQSSVVPANDE